MLVEACRKINTFNEQHPPTGNSTIDLQDPFSMAVNRMLERLQRGDDSVLYM